ncbi:hypothetical protein [Belnapia rosea]|uniref:hypothetical protein n=1 Tax=Belnapia rosea TaxID=938405 RepID=UPI000B890030|nr:hypothetical protein [Belnapia rosea]
MISTDTTALIAVVLADLPPHEQTGLMVLTMRAYIGTARDAGMTDGDIEVSLRAFCGAWIKKAAAMRPAAWFQ